MPKFEIRWNVGFGTSREIVECENETEAVDLAYEQALQEAEAQWSYGAKAVPESQETPEDEEADDAGE